jgi:antitoxin (DNA-binding transcriptional repressor) of toxin-antitoxin stability system
MSETPPEKPGDRPSEGRDPEAVLTQRELRNNSGAIMRGLERGERYLITSNGVPVGELRPRSRRHFTSRTAIAAAFAGAPPVDLARLRADLDAHASQEVTPQGITPEGIEPQDVTPRSGPGASTSRG